MRSEDKPGVRNAKYHLDTHLSFLESDSKPNGERIMPHSYLVNLIDHVRIKLSSPQAAIFLRDMYNKVNNLYSVSHGKLPDDEALQGPILYKIKDAILPFCGYSSLIDDYTSSNINRFFNIAYTDYLMLTPIETDMLIRKSNMLLEKHATHLDDLQNKIANMSESHKGKDKKHGKIT